MRFEIKGYHPSQGLILMAATAATVDEARLQATNIGISVISVRRHWRDRLTMQRAQRFDLLLFSQELQSLLCAGLSIIEALGAVARKESPSLKRTLVEHIIRYLHEGESFSTALRHSPENFPPLYLALVAASEQTGDLGSALTRFIAYQSQMDAVRKRVHSAAIYPVLLLGVGGLVILFLMGYVVPRFARIYEDFGRDLPFMSQLLLQWGNVVWHHGVELALSLLSISAAAVLLWRRYRGQWKVLLTNEWLRLRLQTYELARFYRTLGMLQQGGIPIVTALGMAEELLGEERRTSLQLATTAIRAGIPFSQAMEESGFAPPVALDLLKVGERSGNLGDKMIRIADFFDEELSRWIEWFSKLFEPLLMLAIGLFIAFIVVLLYLPIFELAGSLQ